MDAAQIKTQLLGELKANKQKAALLALVTVIAVIIGMRMALKRTGGAADSASAGQAAVQPSGSFAGSAGFLSDAAGRNDARVHRREEYIRALDKTIKRDIFEPSATFFPVEVVRIAQPDQTEAPTPPVNEAEAHEQAVGRLATTLQLQSTILGDMPSAIINGRLLRENDWISGFQVVKITPDSCVVSREGVTVTLGMDN